MAEAKEVSPATSDATGRRRALREQVGHLPKEPGVYQWRSKAAGGEILYVGKAVDLRARARSYLSGSDRSPKTLALMEEAAGIDYIAVANQKEALLLEQTLIKRHKPRFNVRLKDDRSYPYLKLTAGPWPRLIKTHTYRSDGGTYFGPFPDGYGAFHLMRLLNDLVPLRRCRVLPKTKCLYYDIGKCVAPCIDACTREEYDTLVGRVKAVLTGRANDLMKELRADLEVAAQESRFEDAGRIRDQLAGLQGTMERQHVFTQRLEDRDVAAISATGDTGVVVILHQRDGRIVGQSPFDVEGLADLSPSDALADFLRTHYRDQPAVPRHVTLDTLGADGRLAPTKTVATLVADLEADLRAMADHAVTVEAPQRGEKRRWVEVAHKNAELRLIQEVERRARRGMGAVEALQEALGLAIAPRSIEGFDISHHAGHHTRAAMVSFQDGAPVKALYRTFNMRQVGADQQAGAHTGSGKTRRTVDDYASLFEAVGRRYQRRVAEGKPLPDLVLIDGGKGQLAAARQALQAVGGQAATLPICSLAKRDEEIFVPTRLHPIRLPRDNAGLQLLQRVRDEAHRFGITQVRRQATKAAAAGPLDHIKGIGPKRRAALVQAFGGLEGLRSASVDDLQRVPGVTADIAAAVVQALAEAVSATQTPRDDS